MPDETPSPEDRLSSWKEIAAYLDTTVRTVQRWEEEGLPVHRQAHKKRATVYAFKSEIERWRTSRRGQLPRDEPAAVPHRIRLSWFAAGLAAALVVGWFAFREGGGGASQPSSTPLTALPGVEIHPSLSPDAEQVAFAWRPPDSDNFDIYTIGVDGGSRRQLTNTPEDEISPAWSPDGDKVAFVRPMPDGQRANLVVLSLETGEERGLGAPVVPDRPAAELSPRLLTWTRDSQALIVGAGGASPLRARPQGLYRLSVEGGAIEALTEASWLGVTDYSPALSPDGRQLAFIRGRDWLRGDVYIADLEQIGTPPRRLTSWGRWTVGPMFTGQGDEIIVASGELGGGQAFWSLDPAGRRDPLPLDLPAEDIQGASLAYADGTARLVVSRGSLRTDIWEVATSGDDEPRRVISSSQMDWNPDYSPGGDRLVFETTRSGAPELWTAALDGSDERPLTKERMCWASPPAWSPDGGKVAVSALVDGRHRLFLVSTKDGSVEELTSGENDVTHPVWIEDGTVVQVAVGQDFGPGYLGQMPADGGTVTRAAVNFRTQPGGASEAAKAYSTRENNELFRWRDGEATAVMALLWRLDYQVHAGGVVAFAPGGALMYGETGAELRRLLAVERPWPGVALSPDGSKALFSRIESADYDLRLFEGGW